MSVRRGSGRICKQTIKCELSSLSAWLFIGLLHPRLSCCGVHRFTLLCNHFSQVSFLHSLPSAGVALKTVCFVHKTQRSHSSASLLQIQLKNSTDIHQIQRIRGVRTRMLSLLQRMLRKLNHIMTRFNRQEDLQHLQSTLLQTTDVLIVRTILTRLQKVSCHAHVKCLWGDIQSSKLSSESRFQTRTHHTEWEMLNCGIADRKTCTRHWHDYLLWNIWRRFIVNLNTI